MWTYIAKKGLLLGGTCRVLPRFSCLFNIAAHTFLWERLEGNEILEPDDLDFSLGSCIYRIKIWKKLLNHSELQQPLLVEVTTPKP